MNILKNTGPGTTTIRVLCVLFLILTFLANVLNDDIPMLLSGVDQIMHPERMNALEYIILGGVLINVLYVIYALFGIKHMYIYVVILSSIPIIFNIFTSICAFYIENPYRHPNVDEARLILNILSFLVFLILSAKYGSVEKVAGA